MIDYSFLLQSFLKHNEIVFPSLDSAEGFYSFLNNAGYTAKIYELPRILFDLSARDIKEKVFLVSPPKSEAAVRQ